MKTENSVICNVKWTVAESEMPWCTKNYLQVSNLLATKTSKYAKISSTQS